MFLVTIPMIPCLIDDILSCMTKKNDSQHWFEHILIASKNLVYIPVISLLLVSVGIMIWAVAHIVLGVDWAALSERELLITAVSTIDAFLLGILTLMIAVSLYELYISPISEHEHVPETFIIESLNELKSRLGKVIYMILLVTFFKEVLAHDFKTVNEMVLLAVSICLIALSLYFTREDKKNYE